MTPRASGHAQAPGRYTLDSLVVGAGNRRAVAAACAVAESPGATNNPLFIHGGAGLGKTHLLNGIAHLARRLRPEQTVEEWSLTEFAEQHAAAISSGKTDRWNARWEQAHMLLIDDVQHIAGLQQTQAELQRVIAAMQRSRRQVVVTSDRALADLPDVDDPLLRRLAGGLVVDVGVPDTDTRATILRAAAQGLSFSGNEHAVTDLARIGVTDVRELRAALSRLIADRTIAEVESRAEDVARTVGLDAPAPEPRRSVKEFEAYLAGMSPTLPQDMERAASRLSETIAYWRGEGYPARSLERAAASPKPTAVDGLIETFTKALQRLKALEAQAAVIDPSLAGHEVFRNVEAVGDAEALVAQARAGTLAPTGPSPALSRGSFEVSTSNAFAAAAADAVALHPGNRFNPLVIVGAAGSGKTHLAHAAANEIARRHDGAVACIGAHRFAEELAVAAAAGQIDRWRDRYRSAGALIVDGVHLLAGQAQPQEELGRLFDALDGMGRQMIFTAEQSPNRLRDLSARLRSRVTGGLVVQLEVPDRALRARLAARTLEHCGHRADSDLVQIISEQPAPTLRTVQALVYRLSAASAARNIALTADWARAELGVTPRATRVVTSFQAGDAAFFDREKVIWHWPDPAARVIEDIR